MRRARKQLRRYRRISMKVKRVGYPVPVTVRDIRAAREARHVDRWVLDVALAGCDFPGGIIKIR